MPQVIGLSHNEARKILAEAYRKVFHKEPSDGELDFGLATAFLETRYGRDIGQFAKWASKGQYNWGALESGVPDDDRTMRAFKNAGLHPIKDRGTDAKRSVYFYLFPSDLEAAQAFLMTWGKPDTLKAAKLNSSIGVSKAMKNHGYYEGFWVPPNNPRNLPIPPFKKAKSAEEAERNNIRDYASALNGHVNTVTKPGGIKTTEIKDESQEMQSTNLVEKFLDKLLKFLSLFSSPPTTKANDQNKFLVVIGADDFITKVEYARILQSVLQEEIKINSSIHCNNNIVELNCLLPFSEDNNIKVLDEICAAVSNIFEYSIKKFGNYKTYTVIIPNEKSIYPEINIKLAEVNRKKFKLKLSKGK